MQWDKPEGWPRPAPAALPSMPPLSDGVSSAMAALSLLVTGGGGVDDADTEAGEDATLVYPSFQARRMMGAWEAACSLVVLWQGDSAAPSPRTRVI